MATMSTFNAYSQNKGDRRTGINKLPVTSAYAGLPVPCSPKELAAVQNPRSKPSSSFIMGKIKIQRI